MREGRQAVFKALNRLDRPGAVNAIRWGIVGNALKKTETTLSFMI